MHTTTRYLFVYGTLLDEKNGFGAYLKKHCTFYRDGKFKGKLYNIGNYPGAVFDAETNGFVFGRLFLMNDPGETLKILDDYEGFGKLHPQPNEFVRETLAVETADGRVTCWIYLYNLSPDRLRQITSGNYMEWLQHANRND
jgi:gamma-glutamylcyclotransferase (GGCT)/AIG2-like uncharacterized protein YtfP